MPEAVSNSEKMDENRKDARGGANRFGLHRSLCGFAADRSRHPPFRTLSLIVYGTGRSPSLKTKLPKEIQEMQERPCGATDWASSSVAPPTLHHASIVRLAGGSRPQICPNLRNLRFLTLAVPLRVPLWFFVSFVFPQKTLHLCPALLPVARLPRALFSVLRSLFSVLRALFSGARSAPLCYTSVNVC